MRDQDIGRSLAFSVPFAASSVFSRPGLTRVQPTTEPPIQCEHRRKSHDLAGLLTPCSGHSPLAEHCPGPLRADGGHLVRLKPADNRKTRIEQPRIVEDA